MCCIVVKSKTLHLFSVPTDWTRHQIEQFADSMANAVNSDDTHGIITRKDIDYTPLVIEEGNMVEIKVKY